MVDWTKTIEKINIHWCVASLSRKLDCDGDK